MRTTLSVVVAVGRSGDPSGRDFTRRLQRLLTSFAAGMRRRAQLGFEVVVVDWNVDPNVPALRETLRSAGVVPIRVIEVPHEAHRHVVGDSERTFHEFAAKNVGVARARGERVLVTNVDTIVRSDLVSFCRQAPLRDDSFVRTDRYDFASDEGTGAECSVHERVFVARVRHGESPTTPIDLPVTPGLRVKQWPRSRRLSSERGSSVIWGPRGGVREHFLRGAHTNASGDFVCCSKRAWRRVCGFAEDPTAWLHTDALFVAQLLGAGLRQVIYARPGALLHQDHPRQSDEARYGGAATWPRFLQTIQDIIDGRTAPQLNAGSFGLMDVDLAEHDL